MKFKSFENSWYKGNGLLLYYNNFIMCIIINIESICVYVIC